MSTLLNSLGIDRLSVEERIQLIEEIWESLDADAGAEPPVLTDRQKQELERRIAFLDANPGQTVPWEDVEARLLARLNR